MRLLVDAQAVQSTSSLRGIGRYSLALLRALVRTAGDDSVEVLLNAGDDAERLLRARTALETFLPASAVHVFDAPWPWRHGHRPDVRRAAEAAYAGAVWSLRPDALLVASVFEGDRENVAPLSLARRHVPTAALLYDLIPATDPGTYLVGPGAEDYWRRFDELRAADLLLAISDHSAEQARGLLSPCPPLTTVWGGPYPSGDFPQFETARDERPDLVVPDRFLLTVGGDHPRKNLDRLVAAWGRVPAAARAGVPLVVACGLSTGTVRRLRRTAGRAGLQPHELVLTGRVSERRLQDLYARALAFVFPSTEEGLGMPPIEAMAAGCPTVLARGSSLVELSDDDEAFFDGEDVDDMAGALSRLLRDDGHRDRLAAAAARSAQRFTWDNAGERAWSALRALPRRSLPEPVRPDVRPPEALREASAAAVVALPALDALPDVPDPAPLPVVGGRAGARAAVAPAAALVVAPATASSLVASGVLDVPLVGGADVDEVLRHDPVALAPVAGLDAEPRDLLAAALVPPARWTLQRPRPAWLLLTDRWSEEADRLRAVADAHGGDLVVGRPGAAALAERADVVLVEQGRLAPEVLRGVRCRGAVVVVLAEDGAEVPGWCRSEPAPEGPEDWAAVFAACAREGRTTGWPWRA